MEKFKPSIDWGNELVASTWWVSRPGRSAPRCVLAIADPADPLHHMGQADSGGSPATIFTGRASLPVWTVLAVLLLSVILEVRIAVLLSYYSNDLYSALQVAFQGAGAQNAAQRNSGIHGFWVRDRDLLHPGGNPYQPNPVRYLPDSGLHHPLAGVVDRPSHRGLADRSRLLPRTIRRIHHRQPGSAYPAGHRRLHHRDRHRPQRPTYYSQSMLVFGAVNSVASVASFTVILWRLSGTVDVVWGRRSLRRCSGS